jgi:hypothetical protein
VYQSHEIKKIRFLVDDDVSSDVLVLERNNGSFDLIPVLGSGELIEGPPGPQGPQGPPGPTTPLLLAIANAGSAADSVPYYTGPGSVARTNLTAFGRQLIAEIDAPGAQSILGLGTLATQDGDVSPFGGQLISGLDAPGVRNLLGLGTVVTQDKDAVDIDGGSINGLGQFTVLNAGVGSPLAKLGTGTIPADAITTVQGNPSNPTVLLLQMNTPFINPTPRLLHAIGYVPQGSADSDWYMAQFDAYIDDDGAVSGNADVVAGRFITKALKNSTRPGWGIDAHAWVGSLAVPIVGYSGTPMNGLEVGIAVWADAVCKGGGIHIAHAGNNNTYYGLLIKSNTGLSHPGRVHAAIAVDDELKDDGVTPDGPINYLLYYGDTSGDPATDWATNRLRLFIDVNGLITDRAYGAIPKLKLQRGDGTLWAPIAVANASVLGRFSAGGFYDPSHIAQETAYMQVASTQAFIATAWGSRLEFWITKNNTIAQIQTWLMENDGSLRSARSDGGGFLQLISQTADPGAPSGSKLNLFAGQLDGKDRLWVIGSSVGGVKKLIGPYLAHDVVGNAVANTVTETTLWAALPSIPGNSVQIGDTFRLRAGGTCLYNNNTVDTVRFRIRIGGAAGFDFTTPARALSATAMQWKLDADLTVKSVGSGGQYIISGELMFSTPGGTGLQQTWSVPLLAVINVDTTQARTVDVTAQPSAASANLAVTPNLLRLEKISAW